MERIGTREEGFDVTALQANPASFEECALRPPAGLWLVFELELEDEEVCELVHDHLMLLVPWCPPWKDELCEATQQGQQWMDNAEYGKNKNKSPFSMIYSHLLATHVEI